MSLFVHRLLFVLTASFGAPAWAGAPSLAALRPRLDPTMLPEVPSACVDGRGGWRQQKGPERDRLLEALARFPWKERHIQVPNECRLTVEILCAPDLDGDEAQDFLVRLRWRQPEPGTECDASGALNEAVLVAKRTKDWELVDVVAFTSADNGQLSAVRVSFVQLPSGKIGLTCKTQTKERGRGCKVLGYWVGAVVGSRVERLGEADPSLCVPD